MKTLALLLILAPLASASPILHSLPGAAHTLYLDFDGDPAHGTAPWGTDAERYVTWQRVAEKYSPFNIDITTAPTAGPTIYVGGNGAWTGQVQGGVQGSPLTGYVFPDNLARLSSVGEAAAHETGHLFGLQHQALFLGGTNYVTYNNPGNALTAPIMGKSYDAQRGMWWKGESTAFLLLDANGNLYGPQQDDVAVLTAKLGPAPDRQGVIETLTDTDSFPFHANGVTTITADVAPVGPMLDLRLDVYDLSGVLLASADTASLGETVTLNLPDGDYTAVVGSHGEYGDIGSYSVAFSTPEPGAVWALAFLFISLLSTRQSRVRPAWLGTSSTDSTATNSRRALAIAASRSGASKYAVSLNESCHPDATLSPTTLYRMARV